MHRFQILQLYDIQSIKNFRRIFWRMFVKLILPIILCQNFNFTVFFSLYQAANLASKCIFTKLWFLHDEFSSHILAMGLAQTFSRRSLLIIFSSLCQLLSKIICRSENYLGTMFPCSTPFSTPVSGMYLIRIILFNSSFNIFSRTQYHLHNIVKVDNWWDKLL